MAWRIHDSVVRGEIDNRVRGRVTGRIWLVGRTEPLELKLTGNPWRDLAGGLLEFTNPNPVAGDLEKLSSMQQGTVGDITASRRVKIPEIRMDQIGEYYAACKPWPWHWSYCLYFEWFSERNGRVVIESADYELKIVGTPVWNMTPEEEETQRLANNAAITGFMERLDKAFEGDADPDGDNVVDEDEEKPE